MSGLSGSHCLQGTLDLTASNHYSATNTSGFVDCNVRNSGNSLGITFQLVKWKRSQLVKQKPLSKLADLGRGVRYVSELKWKEH